MLNPRCPYCGSTLRASGARNVVARRAPLRLPGAWLAVGGRLALVGAADFAGPAFGIYLRAAAPTPVPGPTTAGDGDNNDLAGTTGADWITGNGGRDLIQGRAGADVLFHAVVETAEIVE